VAGATALPSPSPLALARAAAQAARAVEGVVDLQGGAVGEFATYGGGERQTGVRVVVTGTPRVSLRLVVAFGRPIPELADQVHTRVREATTALLPAGTDVVVDVHVADVVLHTPALGAGGHAATAAPAS
jgi:uncharacterized alkaline shock family protein YloU